MPGTEIPGLFAYPQVSLHLSAHTIYSITACRMPESGWETYMCGIAGAISFVNDMREDMKAYELMQKSLLRRGPDQRGIVLKREAALIHTRLAVIDINGGRQPMTFSDGGREYTIVYNGELYNTDDIRRELEEEFEFSTRSDTEVVLKSYVKWGGDCVDKFNGIYAFAVYDEHEHKVFLARDRGYGRRRETMTDSKDLQNRPSAFGRRNCLLMRLFWWIGSV